MDLVSMVDMIVEKNGKKFVFSMPIGANWGETYDACFECLMKITELSRQAAEKMEMKPAEEMTQAGE